MQAINIEINISVYIDKDADKRELKHYIINIYNTVVFVHFTSLYIYLIMSCKLSELFLLTYKSFYFYIKYISDSL